MGYCRIDGCTPLEVREQAINAYNAPGSDKFVFLLSIRAAGRGLNLQSSDTVIIYDPDPNPKNEEQVRRPASHPASHPASQTVGQSPRQSMARLI